MKNKGFTLLELMIAGSLGCILLFFGYTILVSSIKTSNQSDQTNEGWLEATSAGTILNLQLKNVLRIEPAENLVENGPAVYSGIMPIFGENAPKDCEKSENYSVLKLTTILRRKNSERILRKWDPNSAGAIGPSNKLHISFTKDVSVFSQPNPPKELALLDIDGRFKRRYEVVSFENVHTTEHPNTGLTSMDASGKPIFYDYTKVLLNDPSLGDGTLRVKHLDEDSEVSFITNSMMLPTETFYVCVSKTTGDVVQIRNNQSWGLFRLGNKKTKILKLKFSFANSDGKSRIDQLPFLEQLETYPKRTCVDLVKFQLTISTNVGKDGKVAPGGGAEISRDVLIPNLNSNRSPSCFEAI